MRGYFERPEADADAAGVEERHQVLERGAARRQHRDIGQRIPDDLDVLGAARDAHRIHLDHVGARVARGDLDAAGRYPAPALRGALAAALVQQQLETEGRLGLLLLRSVGVRCVLVEANIGWIPTLLEQPDDAFRRYRWWTGAHKLMREFPSRVFCRNFWVTFMVDRSGVELRHRMNVDHLMWSTDYPHSGSDWPESFTWLEGQCISYGQSVPYLPIIDQLRKNFGIEEFDGEPEIIAKIEHGMRRMGELEPHIPFLRYLLAVDPGEPAVTGMEAAARRRKIFEALRALGAFLNVYAIEAMVEAGDFFEHALVHGDWKGTARQSVEPQLASGKDVLLEIDWQGARQVRAAMAESVGIFILPPSRAELERRLRARGTDSELVIRRRLADAAADISHWREFDFVVVNDDFPAALQALSDIVRGQGEASRADRPELLSLAESLQG